jgi:hypothetical protein
LVHAAITRTVINSTQAAITWSNMDQPLIPSQRIRTSWPVRSLSVHVRDMQCCNFMMRLDLNQIIVLHPEGRWRRRLVPKTGWQQKRWGFVTTSEDHRITSSGWQHPYSLPSEKVDFEGALIISVNNSPLEVYVKTLHRQMEITWSWTCCHPNKRNHTVHAIFFESANLFKNHFRRNLSSREASNLL